MRVIHILLIVLIACRPVERRPDTSNGELFYASTFKIEKDEKSITLVNTEPWPKATVTKEFSFEQPLKRIVCTSTSHLPYFEMLNAEDVIVGFPNTQFISSENFNERIENGTIKDLGSGQDLNVELLIEAAPDAIIGFDAGGESNSLDKIERLGIPVIYNSDFLEQTPLGRAEYIKFFGALVGKQQLADSIFNAIEKNYQSLVETTQNIEKRATILSGTTYGDTWFLPGGKNWYGQFFNDAGGNYLWGNTDATGWLELSFEAVYEKGHDADYWIGVSTFNSLKELEGQDNRYAKFRAFNEKNVFNYNKKAGPGGGIDFFESAYSRPDLVLSDLIKILHPELLAEYETTYFQRLK